MTARTLYIRPEDAAAAIKHGAVTDCTIWSVNDPRVQLVAVEVAEFEDEAPITTTDEAVVDVAKPWAMPA